MKRLLAPTAVALVACASLLCCTDDAAVDSGTPSPSDDGGSDREDAGVTAPPDAASGDADAATYEDPRDAPGAFVAVGNYMRHVRSLDDGLTWEDEATLLTADAGAGDQVGIRTTAYLNNQFIAFAARIYTSPDGNAWTEARADGQWLASMVYAQGQYVSSGGYGWIATTTSDLANWTQHAPRDNYISAHHSRQALAHGVVGGQDAYVVVNDDGEIFHANDGKTWLAVTGAPVVPAGNTWGTSFAFGGGVFVGLLPDGKATIRSTDRGATWTTNTAFASSATALVYAQKHFTAIGGGHVMTSTDGATWTETDAPTAPGGDVTYGHGTYLVNVWPGKIYRSTDTIAWTVVFDTPSNPNGIASIAFGPR